MADENGPGYLGALLDDERRLVLVPLDPERPWAAFRRMRAWMKRSPRRGAASVDFFEAREPAKDAQIIELPAHS